MVTRRLAARARERARGDRGAAMVEFAFLFPLVLLLTMGIIEFGLALRDYVGVSNIVRDSVRTASAEPQTGATGSLTNIRRGHAGTTTPTSFAYDASRIIESTGTAVPKSTIIDMWVYLANPKGYPSQSLAGWATDTTGSFSSCPAATCVRYAWDNSDASFAYRSGDWDPAKINACAGKPQAMAVGVYMRIQHRSVVPGLVKTDFTISDSSVLRFEPMRNVSCAGT